MNPAPPVISIRTFVSSGLDFDNRSALSHRSNARD